MNFKVFKVGLFLFYALHCYSFLLSRPISQVAQAFLFQHLQPTAQYTNLHENSTSIATSSSYLSNNYNRQQNQRSNTNRARSDQPILSYLAQDSATNDEPDDIAGCPIECHCNKVAQIADCSNRKLVKVPNGFPKDIKRIRLERNNISEIGPYAFEGLKRLQRIDLSNNNLLKIDPLAFAGGLQSLNSLILYSNKLSQLPVELFNELSQLQLLLLNANSLQCINKELFQSLTNLNLLSLYDNNIETLTNGTFDGLKNIKTIHLGKNPLVCDCNLHWLAQYLELNPIETSEARCEGPNRNQGKKLSQLNKQKFKCEGNEQSKTNQIASQCASSQAGDQSSCPAGCICNGSTVDCSQASLTESKSGGASRVPYELPDIPDDIPVYVTRIRLNDNRIKRIRQTGLFRRLANSQKLDLGSNKIIDIEDNAINGLSGSTKPERVVFVLLENNHCSSAPTTTTTTNSNSNAISTDTLTKPQFEDACAMAPKVNAPSFDSPCYHGGSCVSGSNTNSASSNSEITSRTFAILSSNYSCLCPPGFAGPLCEINIDDCAEHQCQNGAMCVDGVNSYRCICRDPTTTGEFCEQLSSNSYATSSANSIAPVALPIIAGTSSNGLSMDTYSSNSQQQQILARSADFSRPPIELASTCKRITQRKYYQDGNGCQSVRVLKISECGGTCGAAGCCLPAKIKRKRVRMQCNDGASYVKTIDLVKKCACSSECALDPQNGLAKQFNATQEDQLLQITRLDAVD